MGYVFVLPEFGLVSDPVVGTITTAGVSYQPVIDQVSELEKVSDDLVGMLSGEGNFLNSYPGREKTLLYAGSVTSMWYGLSIGLLVVGILVVIIMISLLMKGGIL
ncbi:MAG TPA: tetrahydromethanopterin S-methyltransferase subunit B [Methanocorpusculum sp.]|nr:tetrahydromethanopterin S-methyltransferase subunit B [Methanocorpusculum sp.]